uniref:Fibrinogen C-terminal domain-containing protein n=1 Tax=Macrostomum lignano TaxID=282301 RepID=A0A1I8IL33_9PLAT
SGSRPSAHRNSCRGRCGNCLKSSVAFLLSHIGLCVFLSAYILGGAYLFVYLEKGHSINVNREHSDMVWQAGLEMRANVTKPVEQLIQSVHRDYEHLSGGLSNLMNKTRRRLQAAVSLLEREAQHQERLMNQIDASRQRMRNRLQQFNTSSNDSRPLNASSIQQDLKDTAEIQE